ncbi:hypothetical protein RSAG8_00438, partial [Rhizoctonia solani AG-8 WAC10335]
MPTTDSTDSSSSPAPVPLNAGFQDAGDFTLRSSPDDVEFKVYRLFLMTASPVFQDILTAGSGPLQLLRVPDLSHQPPTMPTIDSTDSSTSPAPVPLNVGFQDAGDFTLRSSPDDIEFKVYRLFLMTASPVFQDILTAGSGPPVIELSEDAETIAALLQYIYPRENPVIKDYGLFAKVLEAARKYELGFITSDLRASIRSESASFACLRAEPLRMYALAVRHELKEEIPIAAKLTIGKYDFASIEAASELWALSDLLVNVDSNPRYFAGFPVRCPRCKHEGGSMSELQRGWMKEVVNLLRKEPLAAAQRLFEKEFFLNLKLRCKCSGCRDAEMYDLAHKAWAEESREKLAELKLDDL